MLGGFLGNVTQLVQLLLGDDFGVGIKNPLVLAFLFWHLNHPSEYDGQQQVLLMSNSEVRPLGVTVYLANISPDISPMRSYLS